MDEKRIERWAHKGFGLFGGGLDEEAQNRIVADFEWQARLLRDFRLKIGHHLACIGRQQTDIIQDRIKTRRNKAAIARQKPGLRNNHRD